MFQCDTDLRCFLEHDIDEEYVSLWISLYKKQDGSLINTLEYADITDKYSDFIDINDHYDIYQDTDELDRDIEEGYLARFIDMPRDNPRLDLIFNLRMKMQHQTGSCDNSCILCNPDIGEDPFPDFTFDARNLEPESDV